MQKTYEMTEGQQSIVLALLTERDRQLQRTTEAMNAASSAFAAQAGLDGIWIFEQPGAGQPIHMVPEPDSEK